MLLGEHFLRLLLSSERGIISRRANEKSHYQRNQSKCTAHEICVTQGNKRFLHIFRARFLLSSHPPISSSSSYAFSSSLVSLIHNFFFILILFARLLSLSHSTRATEVGFLASHSMLSVLLYYMLSNFIMPRTCWDFRESRAVKLKLVRRGSWVRCEERELSWVRTRALGLQKSQLQSHFQSLQASQKVNSRAMKSKVSTIDQLWTSQPSRELQNLLQCCDSDSKPKKLFSPLHFNPWSPRWISLWAGKTVIIYCACKFCLWANAGMTQPRALHSFFSIKSN